jgi:hypothetical protein
LLVIIGVVIVTVGIANHHSQAAVVSKPATFFAAHGSFQNHVWGSVAHSHARRQAHFDAINPRATVAWLRLCHHHQLQKVLYVLCDVFASSRLMTRATIA